MTKTLKPLSLEEMDEFFKKMKALTQKHLGKNRPYGVIIAFEKESGTDRSFTVHTFGTITGQNVDLESYKGVVGMIGAIFNKLFSRLTIGGITAYPEGVRPAKKEGGA